MADGLRTDSGGHHSAHSPEPSTHCYDAPRDQTHVTSHFRCTVNLERNVDKRLLRNAHRSPWPSDEEAQTPTL